MDVSTKKRHLVFLGDSFVWEAPGSPLDAELQKLARGRFDMTFKGFVGHNSLDLLKEVPKLDIHGPITCVILLIGANDAHIAGHPKHIPASEFVKNLASLLTHDYWRKLGGPRFFFVTPPPLDEPVRAEWDVERGRGKIRTAALTSQYADIVRQLAKNSTTAGLKVDCIDLHARMAASALPLSCYLKDGLHLNETGYQLFWDILRPYMEAM